MKITDVQWKQAVPTKGIDPKKAFDALESLRKKNKGDLTDDSIVEAARPKNHVLHKWFEWDDSEAAREFRRRQARNLIGSFQVVYKEAPEVKTRAYQVHTKERVGGEARTTYRTTEDVLADPESRDRLIASGVRMAMEFRRRFQGIHELSKIVEAIDQTIPELADAT